MKLDGKTRTAALGAGALGLLIIGGATVAAFRSPDARVSAANTEMAPAPAPSPAAFAAAEPEPAAAVAAAPATQRVAARTPRAYVKKRSGKKSALIIGGSAVGGAIVGKLVGGTKGAIIGAVAGGAAGTVYDRKTRKRVYYR